MAQNTQTFILVGEFKDNITPSLKKLNTSITGLNKNFAKLQKMVRPIAKDMAIMADAATRMSTSFKAQKSGLDASTKSLQQYRRELGKAASAQKQLQKKMRTPAMPGGGGGRTPRGWKGARPKAGGGRGGGGSVVGDVVAGGLITASIVKGFEIGTQMIERSFQYISSAFAERVGDQLADIASAGGIFAAAKNSGLSAFGKTMDDAMDVQKDLNRSMANLAADLPGATNDYVRNARSITDTIMTAMSKQPANFVKQMETMTGKKGLDQRGAMSAATQGIARSTTLLEKLSPGGGIPMTMLFEDMMSRGTIDAKGMQRKYASMRRNPTLVAALERNEKALNATTAGTAERLVAIEKALREAVPPEMVSMMQRSVDGVTELFRSNFMDPDTGLFGLSRQLGFSVRQFSTETGKVRKKLDAQGKETGEELMEAVGIFEMISDIIGNLGVVLGNSVLPALQALIFPFDKLGLSLVNLREYTFKLFEQFQSYTKGFSDLAATKGMDPSSFKATTRAGLGVMANVLEAMGALGKGDHTRITSQLKTVGDTGLGTLSKELFSKFLGSEFMDMITEAAGMIVGGILDAIANLMDMIIEGTDKFAAKGFGKGFQKAGGYSALTRIIANGFKLFAKAIMEGIKLWFASMFENLKRLDFGALLGQLGITAAFLWPFLGGPIKMLLGNILGAIGVRIAAMNIGGLIAGWLPVFVQAFQTLGAFVAPVIVGAFKTLFANIGRMLLSGAGMAAIGALVVAGIVYAFQTPIKNFLSGLSSWVQANVSGPIQKVMLSVIQVWTGTVNVIAGIFGMLIGIVTADGAKIQQSFRQLMLGLKQWFDGLLGILRNAGGAINQGVTILANAVRNFFTMIAQKLASMVGLGPKTPPGLPKPKPIGNGQTKAGSRAYGGGGVTTLGNALATEMRNKPKGSHLVIANSSETIIPAGSAAGGQGNGIAAIVSAIQSSAMNTANVMIRGFGELSKATIAGDTKIAQAQASSTAQLMTAIKAASAFGGFGGMMGGAMKLGSGMGGAGVKVAGMLGNFIKATGGAPGSIHEHPMHGGVKGKHSPGSYHYQGRAIDIGAFANEQGGVISRIQQFNAKYGVRPVEFLYAGNDKNHQDHVHVAYAKGFNNPTLFTNARAAVAYEGMMAPAGSRVLHAKSVTSNSSEIGGRAPVTVNQNITISGAQDPKALAALVFDYAAQAAQRVNNNSFA